MIETLHREITAIIADKGFHERMAKIGVDVVGTSVADYAKFLRRGLRQVGQGGRGGEDRAAVGAPCFSPEMRL